MRQFFGRIKYCWRGLKLSWTVSRTLIPLYQGPHYQLSLHFRVRDYEGQKIIERDPLLECLGVPVCFYKFKNANGTEETVEFPNTGATLIGQRAIL